ncbi:Uncharacterized protein HZ326_0192 [Fusarium oxysporum f. sp. albedinis]|nr:Uncharacterized protein HZ326_0192 [Fusarium oxysporum f. sp. albedinis]
MIQVLADNTTALVKLRLVKGELKGPETTLRYLFVYDTPLHPSAFGKRNFLLVRNLTAHPVLVEVSLPFLGLVCVTLENGRPSNAGPTSTIG